MRIPFFRIFYSTSFTVLSIVLGIFLLLTPASLVYEAFRRRKIYSIFIVSGVYILTLVVAVLLYASRLYANRRALLHIPKAWSPLEKGHVVKRVRKLVAEKLDETAVIAFQARPRDLSKDDTTRTPERSAQAVAQGEHNIQAERSVPPWGIISHPGWSSPSSADLPHLHLNPIIHELPNLLEAKAVSLAPPDPLSTPPDPPDPILPDALIVEYLQRPATMNLRDYIAHLTALGMLTKHTSTTQFLALYERSRFSGTPISEPDFRTLMAVFADILRDLNPLHPSTIQQIRNDNFDNDDENRDSPSTSTAPSTTPSIISDNTTHHTPHPERYFTPHLDHQSLSSGSEAGSEGTVRTAPSQPTVSRRELSRASTSRSTNASGIRGGFRVPKPGEGLRTKKSFASSVGSAGSVIRVAKARTELDLPYTTTGEGEMGV
ncbi:MAG: hypothetical protein Q9168_007148 [Polycauliona sp. 1 TL-2023]